MNIYLPYTGWLIEQPVTTSNGLYKKAKSTWHSVQNILHSLKKSVSAVRDLCYLIPFLISMIVVIILLNAIIFLIFLPITVIWEELVIGLFSTIPFETNSTPENLSLTYARLNRKLSSFNRIIPILKMTAEYHRVSRLKVFTFGSYVYVSYTLNVINRYRSNIAKKKSVMLSHMPIDIPIISGWKSRTPEEVYNGRSGVYDFLS